MNGAEVHNILSAETFFIFVPNQYYNLAML